MFLARLLKSVLLRLGMVTCFALLAGCAASENKLAVPYVVELTASSTINRNDRGVATPVKITVYELKSSTAFETADFFSLQQNPQQVLGEQLLEISSVMLRPGKTELVRAMGNIQAKSLGVIAAFRDLNNSQWRMLISLPEAETTNLYKFWHFSPGEARIVIDVDEKSISLNRNAKSD
ncbi:MAG: type VI secretion system lipoprotein TssJ [Advenella sp.]|jgi:type VI secretion system protein VasD|nr:type VI secretion system lipoprotein TssJ [Advenella sp.]